jgi:hypothetical protein
VPGTAGSGLLAPASSASWQNRTLDRMEQFAKPAERGSEIATLVSALEDSAYLATVRGFVDGSAPLAEEFASEVHPEAASAACAFVEDGLMR